MGLFYRSDEGSDITGTEPAAPSAVADQVAATFDRISAQPLSERAAELLNTIAPAIQQADDYLGMRALLAPWLPDSDWMSWSPEQRATWFSLELVLQEAFQVLVLTRMLIRRESQYKGATDVTYALSPDARAAQSRGDVADVVVGRLAD
jgi:hypothetical protein